MVSKWYFGPNMAKNEVLKGNLSFFFFLFHGFSKTLPVNLWFHDFGGSDKLKLKVLSLKPRVLTENSAEGRILNRIPLVSMKCTFSFNFSDPPNRENRRFTGKV